MLFKLPKKRSSWRTRYWTQTGHTSRHCRSPTCGGHRVYSQTSGSRRVGGRGIGIDPDNTVDRNHGSSTKRLLYNING